MKKIVSLLLTAVLLLGVSGCKEKSAVQNSDNTEETEALQEGDYSALLPFEAGTARNKHAALMTNQTETTTVGKGLMEYSKQHFDPDSYAYKDSQFLTYSALDAVSDGIGLLGRTSEKNPNGLNPKKGASFTTDNGVKTISSEVVLLDIYELDWYQNKELEGISLALVLNSVIGDREDPDIITDEMLRTYGEDAGRKTVSYLRKTHPEIGQKTPIYVTIYKEGGVNNTLPGVFLSEAYFASKTVGEFQDLEEQWVIFPGDAASKLDESTASAFDKLKKEIRNVLPDSTSVIALGYYKEEELDTLEITVTIHAKTYAEAHALIQIINSNMSLFQSKRYGVKVTINNDNELAAVLSREKGSNEVKAIAL